MYMYIQCILSLSEIHICTVYVLYSHLGSETGSVLVVDWRASHSVSSKYNPHTAAVTRMAFAPWK